MKPLVFVNLILAVLLGLCVWSLTENWRAFEETIARSGGAESGEAAAIPSFAQAASAAAPAARTIALGNPFSVDRSSEVAALAAPPATRSPRPYLFGTIRIGDDHMAMMAPASATNRNQSRPIRIGQAVEGWELVEISEKSVVVSSGSTRQTITINDPSARLPRVRQSAQTANSGRQVSTVGAAPGAGSTATPAAAGNVPPAGASSGPTSTPQMRTIVTPFGATVQRPVQ